MRGEGDAIAGRRDGGRASREGELEQMEREA